MDRRSGASRCFGAALAAAMLGAGCAAAPREACRTDAVSVPSPSLAGGLLLNAPRQPALVLLPPSYDDAARRYPVVYFLPGFTTDVTEYVDGSFDGFDMRRTLATHDARHPGAAAIVVIVNGRNALGGSFYVNSPVTGRWEDYVVADVVPWIDAHYRTVRESGSRLLSGEGMGGFGALWLAMRHPEVFGAVYALSPELFDARGLDDQGLLTRPALRKADAIDRERMARWLPADAPRRLADRVADLCAADSLRFNRARVFAYAYGAAFAPDPSGGPPYVAYPWRRPEDGAAGRGAGDAADPARRRAWQDGYGGWEEKIARHREGLRALRGIGLDIGRNDSWSWTPRGARHVAALLRAAEIDVELHEHDGGHYDRIAERVEVGLLPFLARTAAAPRDPPRREAGR